jgi:peptide/nickel transport system ATP-binding protein
LREAWSPDESFLDEIGITPEWLDRYPTELSGGELRRFAVARALAPGTRVVIADEITTMLDVISQAQIWRLILDQVQQRKLGLIAVTHNLELAKHVSTRIIKIEDL